jgi:hypothetical protein
VIAWLMLALSLTAADPAASPQALRLPSWMSGGAPSDPDTTVVLALPAPPSLMAPPRPRDLTRVETTWRPFLGFVGNSWGTIGEMRIEHHFAAPFMIGAEMSPVAIASAGDGVGAATHLRAIGAFVTDYLSLGLGVGARLQRYGSSGLSLAPSLRLGSMDGLNLELTYTHTIAPNKYSGKMTTGFSNVLAKVQVPVSRRLALQLDTGLSLDTWAFATLGLRHRLFGQGGRGTWFVSGGFGLAMVVDKSPCDYNATVPCGSSATSYGPTMSVGLEYRF